MAESNGIIEKPKLGFFQRIRKALLIRNINKTKYNKAPEYLKNDEEVVDALLAHNSYDITEVPFGHQIRALKEKPENIRFLPENSKQSVLKELPDLISQIDRYELLEKIDDRSVSKIYMEYLKNLPIERQVELLTQEQKYYTVKKYGIDTNESHEKSIFPQNTFYKELDMFSPEAVEQAVISLVETAKAQKAYEGENWNLTRKRTYLNLVKIDNLPVDLQIKIALIDNEFISEMAQEAQEKYVGNNPMVFLDMPSSFKVEYVKTHPEFIQLLSQDERKNILYFFPNKEQLSPEIRLKSSIGTYEKPIINNSELYKKILTENWRGSSISASVLTDNIRDTETLAELSRFEPEVLFSQYGEDFTKFKKLGHVTDMFKSQTQDSKITTALEYAQNKLQRNLSNYTLQKTMITSIAKVLLNKKVMERCLPEEIAEFINDPDSQKFKNIIIKTHGERAKQILDDRPMLTIDLIDNIDMFDPIVEEKFGKGVTHNLLSYNSNASKIIGELVRHPEKMHRFEMFDRAIGDYYNDSFADLESKLSNYMQLDDLLQNISEQDLTSERCASLKIAIADIQSRYVKGAYAPNELSTIPLKTLDDLDQYVEKRNRMYDQYVTRNTNPEKIKEAMSRRLFGLTYKRENYSAGTVTLQGMVNAYRLESFVNDERTINSNNFSQDDLDTLELFTIISKIDDPNVLKQIYQELSHRSDIIKVQDVKELKEKVPQQYAQDLVNSLTTVEKAKERAKNGEQGISYQKTDDGFEIISLTGADFKVIEHSTRLDGAGTNNSGISIPNNMPAGKIWRELEEGCSTVSGCVIEANNMHSCDSIGSIHLGFASVPAKQIVGMSPYDAHVSHSKRRIDPEFQYTGAHFDYSEELLRKTAAQVEGIEEKDPTHKYNEATMMRMNVDASGIENYTSDGRIMPDYIIVYGSTTDYHKELAKQFGKDGKPIPIMEIHKEKYPDRSYMRAFQKEDHTIERESGEALKNIKKMVESDDIER